MTLDTTKQKYRLALIALSGLFFVPGLAISQNTRSSATTSDPLYAIAAGLDPLTGQSASIPFTAPTRFAEAPTALPSFSSPAGGRPIFISDGELAATQGFDVPANFGAASVISAPNSIGAPSTMSASPTPQVTFNTIDATGQSTQYFIADSEIVGDETYFVGDSLTFEPLGETDAISGRISGDLPIVGPEYASEIPGMGLSVVNPIQTVSSTQASQIAADIAAGNLGSTGSADSTISQAASVPEDLPIPTIRTYGNQPYVSGELAYVRLGKAELIEPNSLSTPNPVSPVTPVETTDNLNAPSQNGQPATFNLVGGQNQTTTSTPQTAPASTTTPTTDTDSGVGTVTSSNSTNSATASTLCEGPFVVQFDGEEKEIGEADKQRLAALIDACKRENANAIYRVTAYPDPTWSGNATARSIPGARLFSVRFFMVENGVSVANLDLRPGQSTAQFSNAIVVTIN